MIRLLKAVYHRANRPLTSQRPTREVLVIAACRLGVLALWFAVAIATMGLASLFDYWFERMVAQ